MSLVAIDARLRTICLTLPEASEELMRRGPSYRVANKIFALERPWRDRLALWCKVPEGAREIFLAAGPTRFFTVRYYDKTVYVLETVGQAQPSLCDGKYYERSGAQVKEVAPADFPTFFGKYNA